MLQPLDLLLCLKLTTLREPARSLEAIGRELKVSPSSVHRSLERATQAGLVGPDRRPKRAPLLELILHGVRYVYYVAPGELTRGVPTAHAAPPLCRRITQGGDVYVWPDPEATVRGQAIPPLHPSVPKIVQSDPDLYELLALVDAVRVGRARERGLAGEEIGRRLGGGRD